MPSNLAFKLAICINVPVTASILKLRSSSSFSSSKPHPQTWSSCNLSLDPSRLGVETQPAEVRASHDL